MCNLYRMESNVDAIRRVFGAGHGIGANLPALDAIYPGYQAPVIRQQGEARTLGPMAWGWPPFGEIRRPITNIRNLDSRFWASALADPARRCLVPVTAFCEWGPGPKGRKAQFWFDCPDHPLFAFAGLWGGTADAPHFAFLTCAPNDLVGAVHPKAMPVILTDPAQFDAWLSVDAVSARNMQRPLPDAMMRMLGPDAHTAPDDAGTPQPSLF